MQHPNSQYGMFISIEGADGSGKTTAIDGIIRELHALGVTKIKRSREPGGTVIAEQIRHILVNEDPLIESIDQQVQTLLMLAARLQHLKKVIIPALQEGYTFISDRYLDSTAVFQGLMNEQSAFVRGIYCVSELKMLSYRPDYTLFFDVAKETSMARAKGRGVNGLDLIHQGNVRDSTELWRQHFTAMRTVFGEERIHTIDANQDLEGVSAQVRTAMVKILMDQNNRYRNGLSSFVERVGDLAIA